MKKILLLAFLVLPLSVFAQKFGHFNSADIIQLMPEYKTAQTELQKLQSQYEADLKTMQEELGLPPFKKLYIVSYPLYPDEYYSEWDEIEIDFSRISFHEIKYDKHFIKDEYLPNLKELARCLKKGKIPV